MAATATPTAGLCVGAATRRRTHRTLMVEYLLRYKRRYLLGFVCVTAASFLVMLPPVVLSRAVDAIGAGASGRRLAGYAGVILALAAVESLLAVAARYLVSGTSRRVEYELRNDLAEHYLHLDQGFYVRSSTGDLMARCTNDLTIVRDLIGPTFIDAARSAVMLLVGFALMLSVNARLALIAIIYMPLVMAFIVWARAAMERRYLAMQEQFAQLANRVQENISGIRTIKAYAQEETELATFSGENQEMVRRAIAWSRLTAGLWPLMYVAMGASTVLVLWFGGQEVVGGRMTVGQFVEFNAYLAILARPMYGVGWIFIGLQQGMGSMKRVAEVLLTPPAIADPAAPAHLPAGRGIPRSSSGARPPDGVARRADRGPSVQDSETAQPRPPRGEVAFEDVTFGYGERPVLNRLSLRIPAGDTLAVVGATGAGKTTLVNLLTRLYDPWEGRVTLDGVDIRDLPLETLRGAVAVVPQESFLFSESVRDNIAYGRRDPPEAELERAVEVSQFVNDLAQLTHGLETVVGERGVTLSGGQKQRAALARALLKDAPVLVLDDALAHVDTHTEEEILRRLRGVMAERTTILIAHRTSTLASADEIVVLEDGAIVERGAHAVLIARDGVYARYYRKQLLAEQLEEERQGDEGFNAEAQRGTEAREV